MEAHLQYDYTVLPSVCDREMKLGVADLFALFMDIATLHAEQLGVGADVMFSRKLFWLTVKTKVKIFRRPRMLETVTLSTRPLVPERVRAIREYALTRGQEVLARGKTEWAVIETDSGKLHPMGDVFPQGLELAREPAFPGAFARIKPDFSDGEELGAYRVRSTDIDLGGHMNNVAYVRALAGAFSTKEWDAMDVRELEVHFKASCYEGDTLVMQRRERGGFTEVRMSVEGKTVILARIG